MGITSKKALIVRSASFQQLDKNLPELEKAFPNHQFSMLTHEHGVKLAEKYKSIQNIYVYPFKESFSYWRKVSEVQTKTFDSVIVPVANLTGAGFYNVLLFSLSIRARRRYVCNMVSELREISVGSVLWTGFRNSLFKAISYVFTVVLMLPIILLLPLVLKWIEKR